MPPDDAPTRTSSRFSDHPLAGAAMQQPPAVLEAEQGLLGAILANNRAFYMVSGFLRPQHFSDPVHGMLYTEIAKGIVAGEKIDAVLLKQKLEFRSALDEAGGTAYLARLLTAHVAVDMAGDYGKAIHDAWVGRELIATGETLVQEALDRQRDPRELASAAVARIDAALTVSRVREGIMFDGALDGAIEMIEAAYKLGGALPGLSTGMRSVDAATGGLVPAQVTILGGRPGMGKSALGWDWCIHVARVARDIRLQGGTTGVVVGISLEMAASMLGIRALSAAANIPGTALMRGQLTDKQFHSIFLARREMAGLPLMIEDGSGQTQSAVRMRLRQIQRRHGIRLVVLDHLHIWHDDETVKAGDTNQTANRAARMAMEIAKEFGVPVLALAQLNRGSLSRDDKRPTMADLRQGGAIEENADAIMFVHREEYFMADQPPPKSGETQEEKSNRHAQWWAERERVRGKGELIVAKMRYGTMNKTIPLGFDAEYTRWTEPTEAEQSALGRDQFDMMEGLS